MVNLTIVPYFVPGHFLESTIRLRNTIWTPRVSEVTNRVLNWSPITCVGHSKIQNQGARRRQIVSLFLGFLQDYLIPYLNITLFFTSRWRDLMDLYSVTHWVKKDTQLVYHPLMNLWIRWFRLTLVQHLIWLKNPKGFQVNLRVGISPSPGSIAVISKGKTNVWKLSTQGRG